MFPGVQYDFDEAHVLVTGGSNGIGYAIAKAYLNAGAVVTVTGRKPDPSGYDNDLSGFAYIPLELTNKAQALDVASRLSRLDILVNNAGGHQHIHESEWNPAGFDGAIDVNLSSVFHMSDACFDHLRRSEHEGGANVLNISSSSAYFGYEPAPGYSAAKAALIQLTKSYAVAWAKHGIRTNAIAPAYVETNLTAPYRDSIDKKVSQMPVRRLGTPEDIAAATLFLTAPAASWITGQTLPVDGGYTITND